VWSGGQPIWSGAPDPADVPDLPGRWNHPGRLAIHDQLLALCRALFLLHQSFPCKARPGAWALGPSAPPRLPCFPLTATCADA